MKPDLISHLPLTPGSKYGSEGRRLQNPPATFATARPENHPAGGQI